MECINSSNTHCEVYLAPIEVFALLRPDGPLAAAAESRPDLRTNVRALLAEEGAVLRVARVDAEALVRAPVGHPVDDAFRFILARWLATPVTPPRGG